MILKKNKIKQANQEKCCECGKQAVCFWPAVDPDIQSYPYCRECVDKAKFKLIYKLFEK